MHARSNPRRVAVATGAVLTTALAGLAVVASAQASAPRLSSVSTPTYQTNGRVSAILVVKNTVYIGGDFTAVRPPGAAPGTREVARAHVAAFRVDNGKLRSWNPHPNGPVAALAASADGRTIFIGGRFSSLAGTHRRNVGATTAATGVVTGFHANTNGPVLALCRYRSRLYLGGDFTTVRHQPRYHVAAVALGRGLVGSWHPRANSTVRSIRVSGGGTRVYLGGAFSAINGHRSAYLARVSSAGRLLSLRRHPSYPVWALVVGAHRVVAGGNGRGGHVTAFSPRGRVLWAAHMDGGVQALAGFHGAILVGGHFRHVCAGGGGRTCTTVHANRNKLASFNAGTGALNGWHPSANSGLGVFAIRGAGSKVYVGGVFTAVNKSPQQGLDSFLRS